MSMSHANCSHPKTPKARAACRKGRERTTVVDLSSAPEVDTILPVYDVPGFSTGAHMGRADAVRIVRDLCAQHGLNGWHVTFDNRRRRAGACSYAKRQILLSAPLMAARSWADTHMTITHEIAHALTEGHNHDHVWAAKHRELGGDGKRCIEDFVDETAPWIGTCSHGRQFVKYREPKPGAMFRCKCIRGDRTTFTFVRNLT